MWLCHIFADTPPLEVTIQGQAGGVPEVVCGQCVLDLVLEPLTIVVTRISLGPIKLDAETYLKNV